MAENSRAEQIQFDLGLRTDKFSQSLKEVDKAIGKIAKKNLKVPKALDAKSLKPFKKELKDTTREFEGMYRAVAKASRKHGDMLKGEVDAYRKAYGQIEKVATRHADVLEKVRKTGDKDRIKHAEEMARKEINLARKSAMQQQKAFHGKMRSSGGFRAIRSAKEKTVATNEFRKSVDEFKWGDAGKEMGESIGDVAGSIISKDLAGAVKGSMGFLGKALKNSAMGAMKFSQDRKGESGAMGGIAKVIGKLAPGMETVARTITSLGPMMSVFSAGLMGIVKLLIDVEAKGKEMNKELLEGASLGESLASSGWDASAGYHKLNKTLQDIKDEATDMGTNFAMGTNAKEHMAVINVLKREGLSLDSMEKKLQANTEGVKQWSDVTKMSIGYSRIFGVSIDEIASMEADLMTNMGANFSDMKLEFSRMADAAVESGIASNKFFGIIRNVSSDLALYGTRVAAVTQMLGKMGRVMNPRNAAKFMSEFSKGMGDFSTDDRLKMVLLGGPGTVKDIQDSLEKQKTSIVSQLAGKAGVSPEEAQALLEGGTVKGKSLSAIAKDKGFADQQGAMKEGYLNAKRGLKAAKTEGVYGAAQGAKGLDAFSAYEVKKKAALKLSGKGTLEDSIGLRGEKAAEVAGLGGEKFDAMLGMERAIDEHRNDLVNAFKNPDSPESKKLIALAEAAGIHDAEEAKKSPDRAVWETMQGSEEDQKKKADEQLKAAYESGKLSQSMLDKLDVVIDALFNWLYKMLSNIWDIIADIWSGLPSYLGGDKGVAYKQAHMLEKTVMEVKNESVRKAFDAAGGNAGKMKDNLLKGPDSMGEKLMANMRASQTEYDSLQADLKTAPAEKQAGIKKRMAELEAAKGKVWAGATSGPNGATSDQQISALGMMKGKKFEDLKAFMEGQKAKGRSDISINQAMQESGIALDGSEMTEVIGKTMWAMDPAQLAKALPGMSGAYGPSSPAAAAGGAPVAGVPGAVGPVGVKQEPPVTEKQGEQTVAGIAAVETGLTKVKFDKTWMTGPFDKAMTRSVLEAMRQALWEYYLYKDVNKSDMLKWIADTGLDATDGSGVSQAYLAPKNATGTGPMIGIDGHGFAKFAAPEAAASIGPGEKIVPAGSGGGGNTTVNVNVAGIMPADFAGFLKDKINEGIYQYKLRKLRTGG